jgi:hypothetical protein
MKSTWRKSALSYQNDKETLYRVHGTSEPWTIGAEASWGGIRMINKYVIELYDRAVRHTWKLFGLPSSWPKACGGPNAKIGGS